MRVHLTLVGLGCALCLWGAAGCFKSSTLQASFESSSDSSSSPFKSSSPDSDEDKLTYEHDVRDATARHAAVAERDLPAFEKRVTAIAGAHGVTDWEQDPHTYVGIGRGLAKAGVREPQLGRLSAELSHANPHYQDWIRLGYEDAASR